MGLAACYPFAVKTYTNWSRPLMFFAMTQPKNPGRVAQAENPRKRAIKH